MSHTIKEILKRERYRQYKAYIFSITPKIKYIKNLSLNLEVKSKTNHQLNLIRVVIMLDNLQNQNSMGKVEFIIKVLSMMEIGSMEGEKVKENNTHCSLTIVFKVESK
jgi:hypothetical protein